MGAVCSKNIDDPDTVKIHNTNVRRTLPMQYNPGQSQGSVGSISVILSERPCSTRLEPDLVEMMFDDTLSEEEDDPHKTQQVPTRPVQQASRVQLISNQKPVQSQRLSTNLGSYLEKFEEEIQAASFSSGILLTVSEQEIKYQQESTEDSLQQLYGSQINRARQLYNLSHTKNNFVSVDDFQLSVKELSSAPIQNDKSLRKALFYMNGHIYYSNFSSNSCQVLVHHNIKQLGFFKDSNYLLTQVVVQASLESGNTLESHKDVHTFLKKHSQQFKNITQVVLIKETLSCTMYSVKVQGKEDLIVKVPRKHHHSYHFNDVVFSSQLTESLRQENMGAECDGKASSFFPELKEEIFLVDYDNSAVLNYVAIMSDVVHSVYSMTSGPKTQVFELLPEMRSYMSQEVLTQEKLVYIYFQGLTLLQTLYNQGIYHGGISAQTLQLTDTYTLSLSNFEISVFMRNFSKFDYSFQLTQTTNQIGYNKQTASELLRQDGQIQFRKLVQEDWIDMVAAFYIPNFQDVITDKRIAMFIEMCNTQLCKEDQRLDIINNLVQDGLFFFESNFDILEELISNLIDEQMFDAVSVIAHNQLQYGLLKLNQRIIAYSNLVIAEIYVKELPNLTDKIQKAEKHLLDAHQAYQLNQEVLSQDEYSRVCMYLSKIYRLTDKIDKSRRFLELSCKKTTDQATLLKFHLENANLNLAQTKNSEAVDSFKKAYDLGCTLYNQNDFQFYEIQFDLADAMGKAGQMDASSLLFNQLFRSIDGRVGGVHSTVHSSLNHQSHSSILTSQQNLVNYPQANHTTSTFGARLTSQLNQHQSSVSSMQRFAIKLKQKQEFRRAELIILKAIEIKRNLSKGSEVSEEIVYLYSELACIYSKNEGEGELEKAIKCVRKILKIYQSLECGESKQYALALRFLAELYSKNQQEEQAIYVFNQVLEMQQNLLIGDDQLEQVTTLKMLSEELIKFGYIDKGVEMAKQALHIQNTQFKGILNREVQDTMLLLAEAYTFGGENLSSEAIKIYEQLISQDMIDHLDLYRKMAPLYNTHNQFEKAIFYYKKVLKSESQNLLKVQILSKIAGAAKKHGDMQQTIEASSQAFELCRVELGETDILTCRCQVNLASIYLHFGQYSKARLIFNAYLVINDQYEMKDAQSEKLKQMVLTALAQWQDEETPKDNEDEYYDEEEDAHNQKIE